MKTTLLSVLTIFTGALFLSCNLAAQSINTGIHLNDITTEQLPIEYRYISGELDGQFYAIYSVYEGKKNTITFKLNNNLLENNLIISIQDETLKRDSIINIKYTDEGGLFIVNGNERSSSIDNTTFYDLLISFDPKKIEVKLHTIGTGSLRRGYYRLDAVSNRWLKEHNSIINNKWEESIRQDERQKGKQLALTICDSVLNENRLKIEIEKQKLVADFIQLNQNSIYCPSDSKECTDKIDSKLSEIIDTLSYESFNLEQTFSILIDSKGYVSKVFLNKRTLDQKAIHIEDLLVENISTIKFPTKDIKIDEVSWSTSFIFDYKLHFTSSCREDKWRCLNNGKIENYDDHSEIQSNYEQAFRKIHPDLKHGIFRAAICSYQWNDFHSDKIIRIWSI
jgi:hypothetical protein